MDGDIPVLYVDEKNVTRVLFRNEDADETINEIREINVIEEKDSEVEIRIVFANENEPPRTEEPPRCKKSTDYLKKMVETAVVQGSGYSFDINSLLVSVAATE